MERNGKIYCNGCCLSINKQKHITIGPEPDQEHYHNQYTGDCWDRIVRRLPPDHTPQTGQLFLPKQ